MSSTPTAPQGDIFDQVAAEPKGDIFDQVAAEPIAPVAPTPIPSALAPKSSASPNWEGGLLSAGDTAKNVGIGAVKGLGSTVSGVSSLLNKIPHVGNTLAPSAGVKALHSITRPKGTAQDVGFGGEQAGEAFVPGLGEEGVGAKAASLLPDLKYAAPIGSILYNAATQGAVNKLQGGSFGSGAALGAGGSIVGEAGKAVAPSLAESALGITKKYRGFGKTPGKALLEETNAVTPSGVAEQARSKIANLTGKLEAAAKASTKPASTAPALQAVLDESQKAVTRNNKPYYDQVTKLWDQLTKDQFTGAAIPTSVSAEKILNLKRGVGDLVKTWPIEQQKGMAGLVRKVYGALDQELDRAVPESKALNQKISSLIPVSQRAASTEAGAALPQRVMHRFGAHTGALIGAGIGSEAGYRKAGTPGALVGGLAGAIGPELAASPSVQLTLGRGIASPTINRLGRGIASQFLDRNLEDENPDEDEEANRKR